MWVIVVALAVAVLAPALLVRFLEPRLAFFPLAGEQETPRDFGVSFEAVSIATRDGERLHGWWMPSAGARARILYFHGNGGNLSVWAPILAGIARQGYAVLAFDYRGYGVSTGQPTERGLHRDVEAVAEYFWREAEGATPTVYWGRSVGVAMAAHAAALRRPDGVILESGFPDVRSLARTSPVLAIFAIFSTYRFSSVPALRTLEPAVPALVMHGDDDGVIPFSQGQALFEALPEPKRFVAIRGGDHNDAAPPDPDSYWQAVGAFIGSLARR